MSYCKQTAEENAKKLPLMLVRKVFTLQKRFLFCRDIYGTVIINEITYCNKN